MKKFEHQCQFGCNSFKKLKEYYMTNKDLEYRLINLELKVKELEQKININLQTNVGNFYNKEIMDLINSHKIIGSHSDSSVDNKIDNEMFKINPDKIQY